MAPWRCWRATSRSSPSAWRPTPRAAAAIKEHLDVVEGAICEWDAGRRYLNFTESAVDTRCAYSGAAYRRLQAIKTQVDPQDVFRANHPIAPID